MNARRVARELALLTLFQIEKQGADLVPDRITLRDLMLSSVRALVDQAQEHIEMAAEDLAAVSRHIIELEQEHPTNLERPIELEDLPVPIPTTRDMVEKIEQCLRSAEYVAEALRIPEMAALSKNEVVQKYAIQLLQLLKEHEKEIDTLLEEHLEDWRLDRLVKIDLFILRLAVAEMKYVPEVDLSVSINEAVELAKQYSSEESYKFINGVLGKIAIALDPTHAETTHV